jgi:probable O-glycosylation ligase (exosortase A-associated)
MRDLALVGFLCLVLVLGFRRPFLWVLAYAYVDIVSPQHLAYYLLSGVSVSMIVASLAIGGWLLFDSKRGTAVAPRQGLLLLLLGYIYFTTTYADLPVDALSKWDWAWKALFWAIFLPLTLRTRLRVESYLLVMILSASAIIIVGGIKTLLSGGGYGALNLLVDNNTGLYEGSTISTVAVAAVPVILWLMRFGTVFPKDRLVTLFAAGLIFACLLIPIGTEARTGLVCIAVLGILMLRDVQRRMVYMTIVGVAAIIAMPLLPQSFTNRMETISTYQADESATTRLAVWAWTWDYAKNNPMGGGFEAYRQNRLRVQTSGAIDLGSVQLIDRQVLEDRGRAYHSSYFEMLGEQGFPGLLLWLLIQGGGLLRMEVLRRRHRGAQGDDVWIAPLATALQHAQIIYLVGSLFVGIAFQPFMFMLIAVQIGFDTLVSRTKGAGKPQFLRRPAKRAPAAA